MKKIFHRFRNPISNTQYLKSRLHSQRGDTLIEVIIATIIIGTVLFSAYSLSTKAWQLGQNAKERTQAAQILQAQAEGLRALRDNATNYLDFCNLLINKRTGFHLAKTAGGQWEVVSGGDWNPGDELNGGDPALADYYRLTAVAEFFRPVTGGQQGGLAACSAPIGSGDDADKAKITITITWPRLGGGPTETSTLITKLVDTNLPQLAAEGGGGDQPHCSDGINNDPNRDSDIDYDDDSQCASLNDWCESASGYQAQSDSCTGDTVVGGGNTPRCNDGRDNDGDNRIDHSGGGGRPDDDECENDPNDWCESRSGVQSQSSSCSGDIAYLDLPKQLAGLFQTIGVLIYSQSLILGRSHDFA